MRPAGVGTRFETQSAGVRAVDVQNDLRWQSPHRPTPDGPPVVYLHLHIAKTGGTSLNHDLHDLFRNETFRSGEFTWLHFHPRTHLRLAQDPTPTIATGLGSLLQYETRSITMFREPMAHMRSMYEHCARTRRWKATGYPTFRDWLVVQKELFESNKYLEQWGAAEFILSAHLQGPFGCYMAVNFQTGRINAVDIKRFWAFGIMEYYRESMCLFEHEYSGRLSNHCSCDGTGGTVHKNKGQSQFGVSPEEEDIMRQLTAVDRYMYEYALKLFKERVKALEEKYNTQIFCPDE